MAEGAPILHDQMFTAGLGETPSKASNVATKHRLDRGDLAAGFAAVNIFGGFLVTQRMLAMYKKKQK